MLDPHLTTAAAGNPLSADRTARATWISVAVVLVTVALVGVLGSHVISDHLHHTPATTQETP